ncbi:serine protease [Streptomyces sp. M2CJ-2]|uniref:YrhB domain-containing protein n=1 Tax=Streptomyces sp. M2CJ-2 TaxID=2803948 RepID=UPI001922064E|nr:YrhB domain-containing protein [Streptomyces sp. M2CJ-2]MBL3665377.1 serine protease [Streptomyces sp. M2CJ-2]
MLNRDEAVAAASEYLKKKVYPEKPDSVVMLPEASAHYAYGWTVRFDFKEHIETGDAAQAPFTSVVVVPHDGTDPHFSPTCLPVDQYIEQQASGG